MTHNIVKDSYGYNRLRKNNELIILLCVLFGLIVRLGYLIKYPVQPRDAYEYEMIITNWERHGRIVDKVAFFPFSLWILKIPNKLFHYDIINGGIIINVVLGLLMIVILMKISIGVTKNKMAPLIAGLLVASHPTLVRLSCSFLRENTFLFFFLLEMVLFFKYYLSLNYLLLIASSVMGALCFLCRLEGLEGIGIFFIIIVSLCCQKRMKITKGVYHLLLFVLFFVSTSLLICSILNFRTTNIDEIILKVIN